MKIYVGIDNGVSGTIGIIRPDKTLFIKTPTISQLNYTKVKKNITRIDVEALTELLHRQVIYAQPHPAQRNIIALIERPMVNPGRFQATASALRACEATLIVIEGQKIPYQWVDSKEWQKVMLPSGLKGPELKKASKEIGQRLFPDIEHKHEDCDGLLIAEYARRKQL